MFTVYILKSEVTHKHYYGHTKDLLQRLKAHNSGKVRSTKSGRPWKVIHQEEFPTKSEAYQRELFFKSIDGYNFLREQKIV
jgi:putative endonuclease